MMTVIILSVLVFVASYFLTGLVRYYALNNRLMDVPIARSSHVLPTPRGGGLSIVLVFFAMIGCMGLLGWRVSDNNELEKLLWFGILVAGVGFWDDHVHVSARYRLVVHLLAAFGVLWGLPYLPVISVFSFKLDSSFLSYCFYVSMLVWFVNMYNFMDGIDGLASIEAITVSLGAALILFTQYQVGWALVLLLLAFSMIGFLLWNWPPAKIFMGDACSGFLGFSFGAIAIVTSLERGDNLWSWWILLAVFITDATMTLIRRVLRGEKWYLAHRSHAYQILSRRLGSHKRVALGVGMINLFWLLPLAYLSANLTLWAPLVFIVAVFPLFVIAFRVGAGIVND